jgi:membrane protein DedA with SNARE-associated domain
MKVVLVKVIRLGSFLMILESALIPIPSEIIMPFSGFL